jgi:hypothetical protein
VVSVVYNHASGGFLVAKEETHTLHVRAFRIGMIVGVRSLTARGVEQGGATRVAAPRKHGLAFPW